MKHKTRVRIVTKTGAVVFFDLTKEFRKSPHMREFSVDSTELTELMIVVTDAVLYMFTLNYNTSLYFLEIDLCIKCILEYKEE